MSISSQSEWVSVFSDWGNAMQQNSTTLENSIEQAIAENPWFTREDIQYMLDSIVNHYLRFDALTKWIEHYQIKDYTKGKVIGLVMAGNVPWVGFHDMLCALVCGHELRIKLSSKDRVLILFAIDVLKSINENVAARIQCVDKIQDCDAVIATGSNLSATYFEKYFHHIPHIIRKHRNSVAILDGNESTEDILALADDVFLFFGLGCRNVSKLYVPLGYDMSNIIEVFNKAYGDIVHHTKYRNNFDYQLAIYLLNGVKFYQGHNVLILPENKIASPLACLYYEEYENIDELKKLMNNHHQEIQAICSAIPIQGFNTLAMGSLQQPSLFDYADDIDTMQFLLNI